MDTVELFYTPPKDECFEELKSLCIRFWDTFPGFVLWDEKQEQLTRTTVTFNHIEAMLLWQIGYMEMRKQNMKPLTLPQICLLYTSDAADE